MTKRLSVLLGLILWVSCVATAVASVPPAPAPSLPTMALIPAGSFQMGDSFGEGWTHELPVHTVAVSAFYIDRFEVKKALWDEVAWWAATHGYDIVPGSASGTGPAHPVTWVTWYEAVKWANARSTKEGLTPCYTVNGIVYRTGEKTPYCNWSANGYRLPTEAEWEKAARGGAAGRRYPWSDTDAIDASRANYHGYYGGTTPVGSFAPNGYGLYDMAGNVWEWCWDWYGEATYASSPWSNPRGPASEVDGDGRVMRGGILNRPASWCTVAHRHSYGPAYGASNVGFRLVRTAP